MLAAMTDTAATRRPPSRVTIRDVARAAGVSVATVSKVINGRDGIADATSARVLGTQEDFDSGLANVHPTWRLPKECAGMPSGHHGSHQFLVDDFVRACLTGALTPNHVWAAARYNLPGIIAHESALRGGVQLEVPDLGSPPEGARLLEAELEALRPAKPVWELPAPAYRGTAWW